MFITTDFGAFTSATIPRAAGIEDALSPLATSSSYSEHKPPLGYVQSNGHFPPLRPLKCGTKPTYRNRLPHLLLHIGNIHLETLLCVEDMALASTLLHPRGLVWRLPSKFCLLTITNNKVRHSPFVLWYPLRAGIESAIYALPINPKSGECHHTHTSGYGG